MGAALLVIALFHAALREALRLVAAGFALSSLDGLAIDAIFAGRLIWRRLAVYSRYPRACADRLDGPGAPMAIIVPA